MNLTLRRLAFGGLGAAALLWTLRPGFISANANPWVSGGQEGAVEATDGSKITLTCGHMRVINAAGGVRRSAVANGEIVDVIQTNPKEVSLVGLKAGETTVTIWCGEARKATTFHVCVTEVADKEKTSDDEADSDDAKPEVVKLAESNSVASDEPSTIATTDDKEVLPVDFHAAKSLVMTGSPGLAIDGTTSYVQQLPAISIETTAPMSASVGHVLEHQILVRNVGTVAAEQVELRGSFTLDATLIAMEPKAQIVDSKLVWKLGRLDAGAQRKISVRLKPIAPGELACNTNVSFSSTTTVKVQVRESKLTLACSGPAEVLVGEDVHVALTISNAGSGPAENVVIRQLVPEEVIQAGGAAKPGALISRIGTLEPGESRVIETIAPAREAGTARIAVIAESSDGSQTTAEHAVRIRGAKLEIAAIGPEFRYLNRKATYQLTVSNTGDADAHNCNLMMGLPDGLEFIDASGNSAFNPEKHTVGWSLGMIEPGKTMQFNVSATAKSEGEHLARIVAWGDANLVAKADKLTRVEGSTSLSMEIVDLNDPIEVDSETTYKIYVTNRGSKAAENVRIKATIPDGMKFIDAKCPTKFYIEGQEVRFDAIESLDASGVAELAITVKAIKPGAQRLRVVLSGPTLGNSVLTEEVTEVYDE